MMVRTQIWEHSNRDLKEKSFTAVGFEPSNPYYGEIADLLFRSTILWFDHIWPLHGLRGTKRLL